MTFGESTIQSAPSSQLVARVPEFGVNLGQSTDQGIPIAMSGDPSLGCPASVLAVPVRLQKSAGGGTDHYVRAGEKLEDTVVSNPRRNRIVATITGRGLTVPADGVLMLLVYRQSALLAARAARTDPIDIDPAKELDSIDKALQKRPAGDFELGVVAIPLLRRAAKIERQCRFAFASCQYPAGFLDQWPTMASMQLLADLIEHEQNDRDLSLEHALLIGDQVYVDATKGLLDARTRDDRYRSPYDDRLASRAVSAVTARVPTHFMLDDHEIDDNWEPAAPGSPLDAVSEQGAKYQSLRNEGIVGYREYQRDAGPPIGSDEALWYQFSSRQHKLPFFVADTRTDRESRHPGNPGATRIMSSKQFDALCGFMLADRDTPAFIVSPVCLLPRSREATRGAASWIRSDAWQGYPAQFEKLLACIADNDLRHVVFLSGDLHLSGVSFVSITSSKTRRTTTFHVIHSSALYAPFPFANSHIDGLLGVDAFEFHGYRVAVRTEFVQGDGFAIIQAVARAGNWTVDCDFHRADPTRRRVVRFAL